MKELITPENLEEARTRLLSTALAYFKADINVLGIFLGGSMAAGTADAYSDIDLRIIVEPERHADFMKQRREIPKLWPNFLFNEWLPHAQHCVSHFKPFGKIDIFYFNATALSPSPWYGLPITILHDPKGIVAALVKRSEGLPFTVREDDLDVSISKGLAAAHETYRRTMRGELFYALTLLDQLRQHIMQADDWLYDRTPENAVMAKFEKLASGDALTVLRSSYPPCEADAILAALHELVQFYQQQILSLHRKFSPSRPIENDLAALEIVSMTE